MRQSHTMRVAPAVTTERNPSTSAEALLERIQWILSKRELTQEQFCAQAGFPNRTQVASLMHRLRTDRDFHKKMSQLTYDRLAKGGRVSLLWLQFGIGQPDQIGSKLDPQAVAATNTYPNLKITLAYEQARWRKETIDYALSLPWPSDRTPKEWTAKLDAIEADLAKHLK